MLTNDQLVEDALDIAVRHIQDALGVTDGGYAGVFFSDDIVRNNLRLYIAEEICLKNI